MRRAGVLGVIGGLVVALTCGGASVGEAAPRLGVRPLYASPDTRAREQLAAYEAAGQIALADRLRPLAEAPTATWFTGEPPRERARALTTAAQALGQLPVLVAYAVPDRDCGSFSAGGAADDAAYLQWVRELSAGIGDRPAVVVLEPDALAHAVTGCSGGPRPEARYALLRQAVELLTANPQTHVYLDAGHSDWVQDLDALADALRAAGLDEAAGFSLNVSNFQTTADSVAYGRALSARTGGAHFVVDTSRNGNGPVPADEVDGTTWCNPVGRAIGRFPSTLTGDELVDAWLWVKAPGESDGSCRPGEPAAGQWWPEYALALIGV